MGKNHLKRIAMPKTWHLKRKKTKFITRPKPGSAPMAFSMPLAVIMKELVKCAKTTKEVKNIIKQKGVFVDEKRRWDEKTSLGLMDTLSFPQSKEAYRLILTPFGTLTTVPISKEEASIKPVKILGKSILGKDKVQLNIFGGRNLILKKNTYKTNDTLLLSLPGQQVKEHVPFEKGNLVYLTGGKHIGKVGVLKEIKTNRLIFTVDKTDLTTAKRHAFVIGKTKPLVTLTKTK